MLSSEDLQALLDLEQDRSAAYARYLEAKTDYDTLAEALHDKVVEASAGEIPRTAWCHDGYMIEIISSRSDNAKWFRFVPLAETES
jgi:hypothetical protein